MCANYALRLPRRLFFISEIIVGIKMEHVFYFGTKSKRKKKVRNKMRIRSKCRDQKSIFAKFILQDFMD